MFPPKTVNGYVTIIVGLALAVLAAYMGTIGPGESVPLWAILLNAGVGYLALVIKGGGVEIKKPGGGSVVAMIMGLTVTAIALGSGCSPKGYSAAIKSTVAVKRATQATGVALAAGSKAELAAGADTGKVCKRLFAYRDKIRPLARTAVAAAWAAIQTARAAKKKDFDVWAVLRPGACAIILGLREWGHKLPDKGSVVLGKLERYQGLACSPQRAPSGALAVIGAILPGALDFVLWLVQLVGSGDDKLEKEIASWLIGMQEDDVDVLFKARCVIHQLPRTAPPGGD